MLEEQLISRVPRDVRAARQPEHEDGVAGSRMAGANDVVAAASPGQPLGVRKIVYCKVHTPRGQRYCSMMASSSEDEGDGLRVGELMEVQVIDAYCRF